MSLVQTYLENNGYNYYGNAAEDTLVFFVHDEDAPASAEPAGKSNEAIAILIDNPAMNVAETDTEQTGMEQSTDQDFRS